MSRRHIKRNKSKKSAYLDPEYEQAQDALIQSNKRGSKRGKDMSIQLPFNVKNGTHSYSNGGSYSGTAVTYESHFHKGDKVIYDTTNGKALYAGNGRGVDETSGAWDLIIDLASQLPYANPFGCIKERSASRFSVLRKYVLGPKKVASEVLSLDWPDMGIIPATLDFWLKLLELLPKKTVMMCMGGHGRTGTCLASLMIADGVNYYDAIDHVRKEHCDRAIETLTQTKYLHALYMEMLKRNIKHCEDPKLLIDLQEDLAYAEKYVPNSYSDHGEQEPPKAIKQVHSQVSSKVDDVVGDRIKIVGGKLYEQICVDQSCKLSVRECRIGEHQGWIDYEVEENLVNAH